MKKLWFNIKLLFHYLFAGMATADAEITSGEKTSATGDGSSIEQKKEVDNVYSQMLRGEVTEEVKELRYEMYQADRKSYEYQYCGGGHATKKNVFGYNGNVLDEDGLEIELVQENDVTSKSLTDYGIVAYGEHVMYDDTKDNDPDELHDGEPRFHIKYEYNPKFKLENFARKAVIKKTDEENKRVIDVYFWQQPSQFERISRIFTNYLTAVFNREERPTHLEMTEFSFISYKAYGTDASKFYSYDSLVYAGIRVYDGNYVVSYIANVVENGADLLDDVYHKATAEKIENNAPRENVTINLADVSDVLKEPTVTESEANEIFEEVKNGEE